MIIKIKDANPRNPEEWRKLILYTVKNKGYNKNTFKSDFANVINDPVALPSAVDNEYNQFLQYISGLDTTGNDFLTRAKEAFENGQIRDNLILLISSLMYDWLKKKRETNMAQGIQFTKEDYKLAAYDVVSKNGYDKMFYLDQLANALEQDNTRYSHEIELIDEWARMEVEYENGWHNMQPIQFDAVKVWNSEEITSPYTKKMLGIAVKTYLYYSKLGKKRTNKEITEEFSIGDRISINPNNFTMLESWEEERGYGVEIVKYRYSIRYNGLVFEYEGTLTPQDLERANKMNATVKNVRSNGDSKIINISNARIVA